MIELMARGRLVGHRDGSITSGDVGCWGKSACLLTQGHDIPADSDPLAGFATTAPRRMMPAMEDLLLRRAPAAPGEVYDILSGSRIVGRVLLSDAPAASQWVWTLSYDYHEDRTPTHGNAATRDAALHAFARSWNMIRPTSSPWLAHRPPVSPKEVRRSPTDLVEWLAG